MSQSPKHHRGQFTSSFGFILAAAGSAIGLGNLWKFPYVAGNSGGGFFIVFYFLFALILGVPIMLAEMSIGRKTELNPIGAFQKLNKKWTFVGVLCCVCAFIILSYYSVVGGWVLKYIFAYLTGGNFGTDTSAYFGNFISSAFEPAIWHIIFMAFCALVVIGGVAKGIEKASKFMLPCLFILIVVVAIRSVTLPGGMEGVKFLLVPKFDAIGSLRELSNVMVLAMGQIFFSLSLGLGIAITYGSYLKKDSNLQKDAFVIVGLDTLMAVLSGLAILPAVFAFGFAPTAGPGLIFETLPSVFDSMPLGIVFGLLFFILVFFAAATSAIALLEVVAAYFIDHFRWSRIKATVLMAFVMGVIGIFASLSMGPLAGFTIGGMNLFDAMGFLTDKILMPIGAFCICIFVGYVWGVDKVAAEVQHHGVKFHILRFFNVCIKYIAPALILVILVMGLIPA
ncbi:sodium-dependent transporter [Hydrogenoanaerobacterium sp.]|uniref:sodium-dependent transporter n=1 Tax=Hydrogenoanaerobacterium sp. TaxID=2953763 RepID=UPI00289BC2E6|nr:sodium-dependent transporter [Hydrogenoanaerobacterium sp.]